MSGLSALLNAKGARVPTVPMSSRNAQTNKSAKMDVMQDIPPIFDGLDATPANILRIKQSFAKNGFVRIQIAGRVQCREFILELWRKIIMKQPWSKDFRIHLYSAVDKRELDVDDPNDVDEYFDIITSELQPSVRKMMKAAWTLHRGFGACCDPGVFHTEGAWKLRQHPNLYRIAKGLMCQKRLHCDVNRAITKLPQEGDNEFLHFDYNPFAKKNIFPMGLSGKFCASYGQFVCVPGTHTDEFLEDFAEKYGPLYPNVKENATKFGLDKDVDDPLKLIQRKRVIPLPAGVIIMWDNRLCHGQMKTPVKQCIEFGHYIGFDVAEARDRYFQKCNVDEIADRVRSYYEGNAPILWPSFDKIQFYPNRFNSTPSLMKIYLDKLPEVHEMRATRVSKGTGKTVHYLKTPTPLVCQCLDECVCGGYRPPVLTNLGKKLLGLDLWSVKEQQVILPLNDTGDNDQADSTGKRLRASEDAVEAQACTKRTRVHEAHDTEEDEEEYEDSDTEEDEEENGDGDTESDDDEDDKTYSPSAAKGMA